ncbi:MAG: hypothetical protein ACXQS8_07415 [Candidatus Helarchaeales archaeon]
MVSIIHALSGITLFSRVFESFCEKANGEIEADLIGCFVSAIRLFSQEFGQNEIKKIEMSRLKLLIHEREGIIIFFLIDSSDIAAEYEKILKTCLNVFIQMFKTYLHGNFHIERQIFQNFNPVLQELLEIPPERIEPSCLNCPMGRKRNCIFNRVQQKILEFKKEVRES